MNTNKSMYDFLIQSKVVKPNSVAVRFVHHKLTFAKLIKKIDKLADSLVSFGLQKGESVTIALPNIPCAVALVYACSKIGVVANMVHPLVPVKQLISFSQKTESKIIFCFDKIVNNYFSEISESGATIVICNVQDSLNWVENIFYNIVTRKERSNIKLCSKVLTIAQFYSSATSSNSVAVGEDIAVVMHSGGTTAVPKSICLTNSSFNTVSNNTIKVIPSNLEDGCMLGVLPLFHAFGLGVCVHTVLSNNISVCLVPKYSAKLICKLLRTGKINLLAGVPTMYTGMISHQLFSGKHLSCLKFAFCGGDKLSVALKTSFDEVLARNGSSCRLHEGYGLTEICGVFSVNTIQYERASSLGKPLGDMKCEAYDDDLNVLPRNTIGQLCLSGNSLMKGYLNDEEATQDALFNDDSSRWLKTGDLGYVDDDGFIFFKHRIKRVVKVSGVAVFPSEVEAVIGRVHSVKHCCVLPQHNEQRGKVLIAYVCSDDADKDKLKYEIMELCRSNLDKWSIPRNVVFLDTMPLTLIGKVDYRQLEQNLLSEK